MNISAEVQKALFKVLSSSYKVYEVIPKKATYPYIQIGAVNRSTNNTKTSIRYVYDIMIHTWSKGTSSLESKTLNQHVYESIFSDLEIDGLQVGKVKFRNEVNLIEQDLDTNVYHGALNFEITVIVDDKRR